MIHLRASLGRMSTIETGGVLGQTMPWAVDITQPVFLPVLALLQVRMALTTEQVAVFPESACRYSTRQRYPSRQLCVITSQLDVRRW